jgi:hypothetical protein
MKDNKNAFRTEITDIGNDCISAKIPLIFSKVQHDFIKKICELNGERLEQYVYDALLQTIQIDLENPNCFGQTVCKVLLEQWNPIRPK